MIPTNEVLEQLSDELVTIAKGDAVLGTPVAMGAVTIIPISRVSIGLGAGGGRGEGEIPEEHGKKHDHGQEGPSSGAGEGEGAGAGAKARPVAVVVLSDAGAQVLPVPDKKGALDQLLEKIPGIIERFQK